MVSPKGTNQPTDEQLSKYIREIDECNNEVVQNLSKIEGEKSKRQIAKYLFYLDQHKALADPPKFALSTGIGSVLRKPDIERFCNERTPPLIDPTDDPKCFKEAASYQLRLGSRYRLGESDSAEWLTDSKKDLVIPPHGIAVVSTYEWLNIPGCLIARWNLRVRMVYRGLVWVGSLQVDPGYQGFLFCPIYNLSNKPQTLIYKDPLFIIDFVLTTPSPDKYGLWELRGDKYSTFDSDRLDEQQIQSAPKEQFDEMRDVIKSMRDEIRGFQGIMFVVLAIIVAAVAAIASLSVFGQFPGTYCLNWVSIGISIIAVIIASLALFFRFVRRKKK